MKLTKNDFTNIKTALEVEDSIAMNVVRHWNATVPFSYNTIRKVNQCKDFKEYQTRFQSSKRDDEILEILERISKQLEENKKLIKDSIPWVN